LEYIETNSNLKNIFKKYEKYCYRPGNIREMEVQKAAWC